jgi:hypothetical protein
MGLPKLSNFDMIRRSQSDGPMGHFRNPIEPNPQHGTDNMSKGNKRSTSSKRVCAPSRIVEVSRADLEALMGNLVNMEEVIGPAEWMAAAMRIVAMETRDEAVAAAVAVADSLSDRVNAIRANWEEQVRQVRALLRDGTKPQEINGNVIAAPADQRAQG